MWCYANWIEAIGISPLQASPSQVTMARAMQATRIQGTFSCHSETLRGFLCCSAFSCLMGGSSPSKPFGLNSNLELMRSLRCGLVCLELLWKATVKGSQIQVVYVS